MENLLDRLFTSDEDRNKALDSLYDVDLAKSILKARTERGLTQEQLAAAMDVNQSYISQLENASVLPSHKNLKRIARILKVALEPPQLILPSRE